MSDPNIRQLQEIEANERWLAQMPEVRASDEALEAVKLAVRRELAAHTLQAPRRSWRAWTGSLAAAAAVALATTIGWRSLRVEPTLPASHEVITSLPSTGSTTQIVMLDEQLETLEAWSVDDSWQTGGADLYEAFKEVMDDDTGRQNGTM